MSTPNSPHGQIAAVLLSRTYVFAAFGGRGPGVAFLILALSLSAAALIGAWQTPATPNSKLLATDTYSLDLCSPGADTRQQPHVTMSRMH
jgi:hypothetical protein